MNPPTSLKLRWPTGERAIPFGTTVRIGRDASCDVVIDDPNVSRRHAELRTESGGWVLVDTNSTQGVHVAGERVQTVPIAGRVEVVLGRVGTGVTIVLETEHVTPSRGSRASGVLDDAVTEHVRPGGQLREEALGGATVVTGDQLAVECGGRSYRFDPGTDRLVGRDDSADVVSSNPTVSRRHAVLRHDGANWTLEDLGSSGGTYVDGRRVQRVELKGSTAIWLGDPDSGERMIVVASGTRARTPLEAVGRFVRTGRGALVVLAVAAVAIVLSLVAVLGGGGSGSPFADRLAVATVHLIAGSSAGSGTIVDAERGLILTNAHVVAPRAQGTGARDLLVERELSEEADEVLVAVTTGLDRSAEIRYRGEVVAADGMLDVAVVKITKLASGALIEDGDLDGLVDVPLGNSDDLETGARIRVLGYPGIAESDAPTLTQGVIAGSVRDDRLGTNRAYLNIDADISPGNSGGAAFDDRGRLVGIPTLLNLDARTLSRSNRMRPSNLARDLIEAARRGERYESPFYTPLTGDEAIVAVRSIEPTNRSGFTPSCAGAGFDVRPGDDFVSVAVTYEGFTADAHQDLLARVIAVPEAGTPSLIGLATTADQYPFELGEQGCVTVTIDLVGDSGRAPIASGTHVLQIFAGPNYRFLGEVPFAVPGVIDAS